MSLLGQITKIAKDYSSEEIIAKDYSSEEMNDEYTIMLSRNEKIEFGFKLVRDTFMFTNKRLILIDVQGITGHKIEYKSLPYKNISKFSIETVGTFDYDLELKVWVSSEITPTISKKFNEKIDIHEVHRYLAEKVL